MGLSLLPPRQMCLPLQNTGFRCGARSCLNLLPSAKGFLGDLLSCLKGITHPRAALGHSLVSPVRKSSLSQTRFAEQFMQKRTQHQGLSIDPNPVGMQKERASLSTHREIWPEASSDNSAFQTGSHPLLCSCSGSQHLLHHQHVCQLSPGRHCCSCPQRSPMVPTLRTVRLGAQQTANSESRSPGFQSFGDHCRCTSRCQKATGHKKPTKFIGKLNADGPPIT